MQFLLHFYSHAERCVISRVLRGFLYCLDSCLGWFHSDLLLNHASKAKSYSESSWSLWPFVTREHRFQTCIWPPFCDLRRYVSLQQCVFASLGAFLSRLVLLSRNPLDWGHLHSGNEAASMQGWTLALAVYNVWQPDGISYVEVCMCLLISLWRPNILRMMKTGTFCGCGDIWLLFIWEKSFVLQKLAAVIDHTLFW